MNTRATFKPRDVEEPVDYWLNRPLASILVKGLAPLPITPNQVTFLSGVVGIISGIVIATAPVDGTIQVPVAGLILYLSVLLDCADGQLARLRGTSSMLGRYLDGVVDVGAIGASFVGFAVLMYRAGHSFWLINAIGWSAGYSYKVQCHGYDHAKNLYLANTRPESERSKAMPSLEEIRAEVARLREKGERLSAWLLSGFVGFSDAQRSGWQSGRIGLGLQGPRDDQERAIYAERFLPTVKLWVWNGVGVRMVATVIACLVTPFFRDAFGVYCLVLLLPMNAFTAYIVWRERRIERALQDDLGRIAPTETARA